eukprot:1015711-Amphidinium_carterae.1
MGLVQPSATPAIYWGEDDSMHGEYHEDETAEAEEEEVPWDPGASYVEEEVISEDQAQIILAQGHNTPHAAPRPTHGQA